MTQRHAKRLPTGPCPGCGAPLGDTLTTKWGRTIFVSRHFAPGDWTLCEDCAAVLLMDDHMRPILPPPAVYDLLQRTHPAMHARIERDRTNLLAEIADATRARS
jgi:hypothetical protein